MARYELPTVPELSELGAPRENAITVYAPATAADFEVAQTTVKSALDQGLRTLREQGITHATETALKERAADVLGDPGWQQLSRSVAVFVTPESAEVFVLPNNLEYQTQVGRYFDLGQLVRAVVTPQRAFALTLSGDGWNLWEATASAVAAEMDVDAEGIGDVAEANNRATVRGRSHERRLHADEGNKVLLESYAKRAEDAVGSTLDAADPSGRVPLFLFATEPLVGIYGQVHQGRREVIVVHGAPDELKADQIDADIRTRLGGINAERANETVSGIADATSRGVVATDLADIGRAAVAGAVDTLVYDFTVDVHGRIDNESGEVSFADDGYDVLSRIAVKVLENGGHVVPVRDSEITSDVWNGTAVARLRYPLS